MIRGEQFSRAVGLAVGAVLLAGCLTANNPLPSQTGETPDPFGFSLRVARHTDQPFTEERMDSILAGASAILQQQDFECPDVACPVTFTRSGDISTFDAASAIVTTERQLDTIFEQPGDIKIVTLMIGVCGATSPGNAAVILGCGFSGGSAVLVHDAPTDVWAHEWGHVQGLPHRDDCFRNLMHSFELETNAVNTTERNAFLTPTPSGGLFKATPAAESPGGWQLARGVDEPLDVWLEDVLSRQYLAGIPADAFALEENRDAVVDALFAALDTSPGGSHRLNTIRALGLLGDPLACPILIEQLEALHDTIDRGALAVAAEALLALGRLSGVDGTDATIHTLIADTSAAHWREKGVQLAQADGTLLDLADALARLAVMSLGLSSHPAAREHLSRLQEELRTGRLQSSDMADQVDEALARLAGTPLRVRTGARAGMMP